MGVVQLKEKVAAIAARHLLETGNPLNCDDFFVGPYRYLLMDFGPGDVDAAINELVRDGVLRQSTRAGVQVLKPTRRHISQSSTALRRVMDEMKRHLEIRYAAEYDRERTYRV